MTAVKFPERNAEIVQRRQAGEEPRQIVRNMHLTRGVVLGVLYRSGMTDDLSPQAGRRTPEPYRRAVLAFARAFGVAAAAREYGVSRTSLHEWRAGL